MMICNNLNQCSKLQAEQADWLADTDEEIDEQELEAHYSFMAKIQEVLPEESSSTDQPLEQKDDSNVTPDSSNICNNDNQVDQNATECVDERVALANLIANLTLDTEENKTILKQLKKANASLTQELKECRTNLDETGRALGEATSCRDSCLIALQNKQNEFEKYKAFNDRTIDYDILQTKLNETLGLLARKDIDIKEGLKTKAYEISVVNQKHDELVKKSLLTKSQFEGQLKEKSKVISDLKVKEGRDIDKMIEMDKQIKFLNEILYKRNQSIQTIHIFESSNARQEHTINLVKKKLIEKCKGKSVETQFDKPSVVRQPNAQRIPKPSVLGKPTPFSNSPEMRSFQTKQSVNKTNVSDGSSKQVTQQNLPQNRKQAEIHTNTLTPGMYRICHSAQHKTENPQLPSCF
ncbi:hypothetical protein Tco_0925112 [Tanacetum coccineum]|uniref:Uncharacterized protein n=1 Tax=Tanacetum coccineum TaxID=301880 RepID=A0ABQ5D8R2_9ASTR